MLTEMPKIHLFAHHHQACKHAYGLFFGICSLLSKKIFFSCDPDWGWSLNRGVFTFETNAWNEIEQQLTLNTPGVRDGIVSIKVNGVEKIRYDNIVFRIAQYPDITIDGLDVETFFGGNTPDWASPTRQVSKFSNFILLSEVASSSAHRVSYLSKIFAFGMVGYSFMLCFYIFHF